MSNYGPLPHSTAPWVYDPNAMRVSADGGKLTVAEMRGFEYLSGPSEPESKGGIRTIDANGRLCAAAPDLLEAAQRAVESWENTLLSEVEICQLRAAICLALGKAVNCG